MTSVMEVNTSTEPVLAALREQLTCYQLLYQLAQRQHECVRAGQTERLLEVLGQRQQSLDRIAALERALAQAKSDWPAYLAGLEAGHRQEAEELLAQTRKLLEAIVSGDRDDSVILQQQKLNVGQQLNATRTHQQVNRRYAASAYGKPPARLDVQR